MRIHKGHFKKQIIPAELPRLFSEAATVLLPDPARPDPDRPELARPLPRLVPLCAL